MQPQSSKAKAAPYQPRRAALNWVDFLVILATVLVFGAVVMANNPHARAQTRTGNTVSTGLFAPAIEGSDDLGLIKARIRLAQGAPWS